MNVTYLGADPGLAGEREKKGSIIVARLFLGESLAGFVTTQLSGGLKEMKTRSPVSCFQDAAVAPNGIASRQREG